MTEEIIIALVPCLLVLIVFVYCAYMFRGDDDRFGF